MSAPTHSEQDLSRREEMTISGAAMSGAPWGAAVVTGGVVAVGDFGLHVIGSGLSGFGLSGLSGSVAMGAVAFFVVAAAGRPVARPAEPGHPLGQEQSVALRRLARARVRGHRAGALRGHRRRHY